MTGNKNMRRTTGLGLSLATLALLVACSGEPGETGGSATSSSTGGMATTSGSLGTTSSTTGLGGAGGSTPQPPDLDAVLSALRADREGTLLAQSAAGGWPLQTNQGWLFVSTDVSLSHLAGDHDQWSPEAMTEDQGFAWIVEPTIPENDHYKFTDGQTWLADPWARSVRYDSFGELSVARATGERLDRWFGIGDAALQKRTVRAWVPEGVITHELYVHDGQNLFDPGAAWGGWHLQDTVPSGMLLVGIDNTPARMDEYTPTRDATRMAGGRGAQYLRFLVEELKPLIDASFRTLPGREHTALAGSSLGGLITAYAGVHRAEVFGLLGIFSPSTWWDDRMILREVMGLAARPVRPLRVYIDSGDSGPSADDRANTEQHAAAWRALGYRDGETLRYVVEAGGQHNEAAWARRFPGAMRFLLGPRSP